MLVKDLTSIISWASKVTTRTSAGTSLKSHLKLHQIKKDLRVEASPAGLLEEHRERDDICHDEVTF